MKKNLILAIAIVGALALNAQNAAVNITLKNGSNQSNTLSLITGVTGYNSTLVAPMPNSANTALYAIDANDRYMTYTDNTIADLALGFATNALSLSEQNYTLEFEVVMSNETLMLTDLVADSTFAINAGIAPYAFTVTMADAPSFVAGQHNYINDRFVINYSGFTPDAGELNICHQYGALTINNNPYTTNIIVKDSEGNVVINRAPVATPQNISLAGLNEGLYSVELGDKVLYIKVQN